MELPLPSGVADFYRQAGLLALGSAGESQPSHRSVPRQWPAQRLNSSVPDYSGGTAPESHRVPDCLSDIMIEGIIIKGH